jgi:hypothetical protein
MRWRHKPANAIVEPEHNVSAAVVKLLGPEWLNLHFWHATNEGKRSWKGVGYQKAEGFDAGLPDLMISAVPPDPPSWWYSDHPLWMGTRGKITPCGPRGVAIETKRLDKTHLKPEQLDRLQKLRADLWLVFVCPGYQDHLDALALCGWSVPR